MTIISHKQLCQAFDPLMIIPEKTYRILDNYMRANTSCVAPASIFLEGSHGKRYLCDYHYAFEKYTTLQRRPDLWPEIEAYVIDEREEIKKTFAKNVTTTETINNFCWCKKQSYVKLTDKTFGGIAFFCNFHFRKLYYRTYSQGVIFEDKWNIVDERSRMNLSIAEEVTPSDFII